MKHKQQQSRTGGPLGDFIRGRRTAKGWTLGDAEAASDIDRTYWSKLELGIFKHPDPRYLARIADSLGVPLEDVYGLAGYTAAERLPTFRPYLRSKYHLPPEAITQLESYFSFLRNQYGIPDGAPVFPKKTKPGAAEPVQSGSPEDEPDGPWNDQSLGYDDLTSRSVA
ncbi:MAG: hypothetical protein QOF60_3112 [Actinomycetota bacterium]|nr:hypothetical protein [Actinomycetota bacterium]